MTTSLDHPRVRGEKAHADPTHLWRAGSPPRVRGKVSAGGRDARQPGITSACAGKRSSCASTRLVARDHPRVCGEKRPCRARKMQGAGSPPRVRGKAPAGPARTACTGITPACAGKSVSRHSLSTSTSGSPPRVRGKDTSSNPVQNRVRITPACAGKSSASRKTAGTFWDHPRVCGEKHNAERCYQPE